MIRVPTPDEFRVLPYKERMRLYWQLRRLLGEWAATELDQP
jgi:hypothetical protein